MKLIRLLALAAVAAAIVWLTREHLLPTPHISHEPPPPYRSTPPAPAREPDDLTAIKGIGPVYASRLADIGVVSFHTLAGTDAQTIISATGASAGAVDEWIAQAKGRTN